MKRLPLVVTFALLFTALFVQPGRATLVLHLDASDGSTVLNTGAVPASDGDPVGTWVDLAGAPQSAAPTVGNPVYDIDGGPMGQAVIDFNLPVSNLVTGGVPARTITMVHRWDSTPSSGTSSYLLDARAGIPNSYVWQGGVGSNWAAFVNDSLVSTGSIASIRSDMWQITTFVGSSAASDDIHLFSRYTDNEFGLGSLAEVRVYDTALTESERLAVVDELNAKWIPEPASATLALMGLAALALRRRRVA